MSRHEYQASNEISMQGQPFYGLIMAAMRQADTINLAKLRAAFPETHAELMTRYNAPGGWLSGDQGVPDNVLDIIRSRQRIEGMK